MIRMQTNHGEIAIELDHDKAPNTCANFERYVREGFYDGTLFHRVIPGFMIQGGGFVPGMQQKAAHEPIQNEADNGLKNVTGSLAMARTPDPHSASSQFFINVSDNDFLNYTAPTQNGWGYCVFGRVVEGIEVVETIAQQTTGTQGMHQDVPQQDVLIESVRIED